MACAMLSQLYDDWAKCKDDWANCKPMCCPMRRGFAPDSGCFARAKGETIGESEYSLRLNVPGFNSRHITIEAVAGSSASPPELLVTVGDRPPRRHRLPPSADVDRAAAWCENGVLRVSVPLAEEELFQVSVGSAPLTGRMEAEGAPAPGGEEADGEEDDDFYSVRLPVPGRSAADVAVELVRRGPAGYRLRVRLGPGAAARVREFDLPADADAAAVEAACVDGVLEARVPKLAPEPVAVADTIEMLFLSDEEEEEADGAGGAAGDEDPKGKQPAAAAPAAPAGFQTSLDVPGAPAAGVGLSLSVSRRRLRVLVPAREAAGARVEAIELPAAVKGPGAVKAAVADGVLYVGVAPRGFEAEPARSLVPVGAGAPPAAAPGAEAAAAGGAAEAMEEDGEERAAVGAGDEAAEATAEWSQEGQEEEGGAEAPPPGGAGAGEGAAPTGAPAAAEAGEAPAQEAEYVTVDALDVDVAVERSGE